MVLLGKLSKLLAAVCSLAEGQVNLGDWDFLPLLNTITLMCLEEKSLEIRLNQLETNQSTSP